jgi:hypothetical protein
MSVTGRFQFVLPVAVLGYLVLPAALCAQEPGRLRVRRPEPAQTVTPSPPPPTHQWVLTGPYYRSQCVTCGTPDCRRIGLRHRKQYTPFYMYVWTKVEGTQAATVPEATVPVPSHEAPYVGNPGPGSVR